MADGMRRLERVTWWGCIYGVLVGIVAVTPDLACLERPDTADDHRDDDDGHQGQARDQAGLVGGALISVDSCGWLLQSRHTSQHV
jgi:hypothetical protein